MEHAWLHACVVRACVCDCVLHITKRVADCNCSFV